MKNVIRPYLIISLCGILALAPVSFMLQALKNDILALEYPINYFISNAIRHGEFPLWFNTWGEGFPLHSTLSWGIFSTPRMIFSSLFDYNLYTLHAEFIFYVLLSGWGMFYLLKTSILKEEKISLLLAIGYMLSGFTVGSSQWLLYISAAAFLPLIVSSFLTLLRYPSFANSLKAAAVYTLMFTSVYAAFSIIITYGIFIFVAASIWRARKNKQMWQALMKQSAITLLLILLFCIPVLLFTLEVVGQISRGGGIDVTSDFFCSNYLHPAALSSMLLPFSSVKMHFFNTESMMQNTYAGLFTLLTAPVALVTAWKQKNRIAFILLGMALFFLATSFGDLMPVRKLLNLLPGFTYFRNPALFRLFFIFLLLMFIACSFSDKKTEQVFQNPLFLPVTGIVGAILLVLLFLNRHAVSGVFNQSFFSAFHNMTFSAAVILSSALQICILLLTVFLVRKGKWKPAVWVFCADLVVNTLLCTPFFSVSSYSLNKVLHILPIEKGFAVQSGNLSLFPATVKDDRGNTWHNVNVFRGVVSLEESYRGPLVLTSIHKTSGFEASDKPLVYASCDSFETSVQILIQHPSHVRVAFQTATECDITLQQNYFKGWKAYLNGVPLAITVKNRPGITVHVPAGSGQVDFRYDRKEIKLTAIVLHFAILLCFIAGGLIPRYKKKFKSSSPS